MSIRTICCKNSLKCVVLKIKKKKKSETKKYLLFQEMSGHNNSNNSNNSNSMIHEGKDEHLSIP